MLAATKTKTLSRSVKFEATECNENVNFIDINGKHISIFALVFPNSKRNGKCYEIEREEKKLIYIY